MDSGFKNPNKRINIHLLDDCLSLIFEKLKEKVDQDSFGLTCHTFLDIQSSSRKHLRYHHRDLSLNIPDADSHIFNILNRFRQLESLSLKRCCYLLDSGLTPLQMYGSKLQSLDLSFCARLTDNGLSYVASGCPLLSVVSLHACLPITDYGLQILTESCKTLKEVYLSWCPEITDTGIQCLNQNCRQLTKLGIYGCSKILGEGFQGVSPTLSCLEAKYWAFDSKSVSPILSGGGIVYLNLSSDFKVPRECDVAAIGLGFGAHLKILNLNNCNFVEDATIAKIAKGCPLLQEWNLSGCDKIKDLGWQSIGDYCQNLEILHVNRCENLSQRRLEALVDGCARLSVIYMASSNLISHWINNVKIKKEDSSWQIITPNWAFTLPYSGF